MWGAERGCVCVRPSLTSELSLIEYFSPVLTNGEKIGQDGTKQPLWPPVNTIWVNTGESDAVVAFNGYVSSSWRLQRCCVRGRGWDGG